MAETEGSAFLDAEDLLILGLGSGSSSASASAEADAENVTHVPDSHSAVSASASVPPDSTALSSSRKKRKKRKINRAKDDTAAKKKFKTTPERDLPAGVHKAEAGKFLTQTYWVGKTRYIGMFDTPEKASAAYKSVKEDLARVKSSALSAGEVNDVFDAAKKKALESFGGFVPKKRDLPQGVYMKPSGTFAASTQWGGKARCIGCFDTLEQASAAYSSVRKDLDHAKSAAFNSDKVDAIFDTAKKKALVAVGRLAERKLPTGVRKLKSGKSQSQVWWGDKQRYIGTFDTLEQASAACMSVRNDLEDAKSSTLTTDEVNAVFVEARTKALEAVGGFVTRDLPLGVQKRSSGKFKAEISFGGKRRHIGTFENPEQASAAYMSVKKDLADAKLSVVGSDEVDAVFDVAKEKALELFGEKRDLPKGVVKRPSGKFSAQMQRGGKKHYIGTFDTPEQASAAFKSVKKDVDRAKLSAVGADEVNAAFDAAKKKVSETVGGFVSRKKNKPKTSSKRHLPRSVAKNSINTVPSAEEENLCVICDDAKKRVLLLPCRHLCLCSACSKLEKLTECPMCRATISDKIEAFV